MIEHRGSANGAVVAGFPLTFLLSSNAADISTADVANAILDSNNVGYRNLHDPSKCCTTAITVRICVYWFMVLSNFLKQFSKSDVISYGVFLVSCEGKYIYFLSF